MKSDIEITSEFTVAGAGAARYVTYAMDGALDGCFLQVPSAEHIERMIVITEEQAAGWVMYRANEARDGIEILPPALPQPPDVPQQVTRRQARQALLLAGLLDKVEPAIAAITDPVQRGLAQIEWEDSQVFERQRPVLISLAEAVGLDSEELDQLFINAAGL